MIADASCRRIGDKVIQICASLIDVDGQVQERCLAIESYWQAARLQLDLLKRVESALDNELCRVIDEQLLQLSQKLSLADAALEKISKKSGSNRRRFWGLGAKTKKVSWAWKKDALDRIISDLDTWHRRFDPLWFMVTNTNNPLVDDALVGARSAHAHRSIAHGSPSVAEDPLTVAAGMRRALYPTANGLKSKFLTGVQMETSEIPFSGAKNGFIGSERRWYIIDTVQVGSWAEAEVVSKDVSMLAAKLAQADPLAFGLLNCEGVIPVQSKSMGLPTSSLGPSFLTSRPNYSSFQLVFRVPENLSVLRSLRQLLLNSDEHISLSRKMLIARELAKAIHYVHTFAFVHKNVRPESILCFENAASSHSHAFLIGFDAFRSAGGGTIMAGDIGWERNVYRHPSRQGYDPTEKYRMEHDIYSLGVCLLEIGLWETFVEYTTGEEGDFERPRARVGKTFHHFEEWFAEKRTGAGQGSIAPTFDALKLGLKDYLVEQAKTRLAPRMGDRYAQVVLACLTCLDEESENFGEPDSEMEDVGEDRVAICFAEKILSDLDQLSMI